MKNRTLQALRNLAERPGTQAEGELAREILARHKDGRTTEKERPPWMALEDLLRKDISTEEFIEALRRHAQRPLPTEWTCACGATLPIGTTCANSIGHLAIQQAIREKFVRGDRVFYNRWAYKPNCPGSVAAHVRLQRENGDYPWAWLSVKFDHLKAARQVPIYSAKGWHLSKEPVNDQESTRLIRA